MLTTLHLFLGERDGQNGQIPEEAIAELLLPTKEAGQVAHLALPGKGRGGEHLQKKRCGTNQEHVRIYLGSRAF